jgi:hypothetical protein
MNTSWKGTLFWTPRLITILFIAFISLFALDVFSEGYGFWETIVALTMHLLPSIVLTIILILAWKWEWIGGVLYLIAGFVLWVKTEPSSGLAWFLLVGMPFLLGVLFTLGWITKKDVQS